MLLVIFVYLFQSHYIHKSHGEVSLVEQPIIDFHGVGIGPLSKILAVKGHRHLILRKDIGAGGWSRKWQISLTLCSENVLT